MWDTSRRHPSGAGRTRVVRVVHSMRMARMHSMIVIMRVISSRRCRVSRIGRWMKMPRWLKVPLLRMLVSSWVDGLMLMIVMHHAGMIGRMVGLAMSMMVRRISVHDLFVLTWQFRVVSSCVRQVKLRSWLIWHRQLLAVLTKIL